jgi:hypothetical protein
MKLMSMATSLAAAATLLLGLAQSPHGHTAYQRDASDGLETFMKVGLIKQKRNGKFLETPDGKAIDPRMPLDPGAKKLSPTLRMSDAELATVHNSIAILQCGPPDKQSFTEATRFESGRPTDTGRQVVFAFHALEDEKGNVAGPCYLRIIGKSVIPDRIELEFATLEKIDRPYLADGEQLAMMMIKKIPGLKLPPGLPLNRNDQTVPFGESFALVSTASLNRQRNGPAFHDDHGRPVAAVQECSRPWDAELRRVGKAARDGTVYSDCTATVNSSGSIGLVRLDDQSKTMVINSILVSATQERSDDQPFHLDDDDIGKKSFAKSIVITEDIAAQMRAYAEKNETRQ